MTQILDQVILVNDADEEIGVMDKLEAHRGEGQLHRAISVFLKRADGTWLVQQRSAQKIVGALQWANTCCGNVRPGESAQECAYRRLREELGITQVEITEIYSFKYFARCNEEFSEREIDHVFVGTYDGDVVPVAKEVADYQWLPIVAIQDSLGAQPEKWAPWFRIMMQDETLLEILIATNHVN